MSDTNRVSLSKIREVTPGVIPATPTLTAIRLTGAPNLQTEPNVVTSNELRADRRIVSRTLVGTQAGGDVAHELSAEAFNEIFEDAMFEVWTKIADKFNVTADTEITDAGTVANTYAVDAGGTSFVLGHLARASGFTNAANNQRFRVASSTATTVVGTSLGLTAETAPPAGARLRVVGFEGAADDLDAQAGPNELQSTSLDFTTLGLADGMWLKIGGAAAGQQFTTAANNGWVRIASGGIAANVLTLDRVPTGWATELSSGSKTIQVWTPDYIREGTTKHTSSFEMINNDHSPVTYQYFNGMICGNLVINIAAQSIITMTTTWLGTNNSLTETRESGATVAAAAAQPVMNSSSNVGRIAENGVPLSGKNGVLNASIQVNNLLRPLAEVGKISPSDIGAGEADITGQLEVYFGDKSLAEKVINNTRTSLELVVTSGDQNQTYVFDVPRCVYTAGAPGTPGKNDDTTVPLEWGAEMHPDFGFMMQIQRFSETA